MNALIPVIASLGKYSIKETCAFLGIHRETLRRWEREGIITRSGCRKCNGRPFFYGKEILRVLKS